MKRLEAAECRAEPRVEKSGSLSSGGASDEKCVVGATVGGMPGGRGGGERSSRSCRRGVVLSGHHASWIACDTLACAKSARAPVVSQDQECGT